MPLGDLASKDETRAIATELGLAVANKPDSQEICFVQGGSYTDFLAEKAPETVQSRYDCGHFRQALAASTTGWRSTPSGQRKRINVGSPIPLYVIALDPQSNTVVVGDDDDLLADALLAEGLQLDRRARHEGFAEGDGENSLQHASRSG